MSDKKTKIGKFLQKIGKGGLIKKIIGVGGELITGDVAGAIEKLTSSGELTKEEAAIALEMYRLDIEDVQNARDNETARDTNPNSGFLSRNIHEIIALIVVVAWIVSWHIELPENVRPQIDKAIFLILGYLYGKSKPD